MLTWQMVSELYPEEGEQNGNAMRKAGWGSPSTQGSPFPSHACQEAGEEISEH